MKRKYMRYLALLFAISACLLVWIRYKSDRFSKPKVEVTPSQSSGGTISIQKTHRVDDGVISSIGVPENKVSHLIDEKITDPSKRSQDEKLSGIKRGLRYQYAKAVAGLGLQGDEEEKVWDYLVAREVAASIAQDVVSNTDLHVRDRLDLGAISSASRADVDLEWKQKFDVQTYQKIKAMIDAQKYIGALNHSFDAAFTASGSSLTPKQFLTLATLMLDAYGPSGYPSNSASILAGDSASVLSTQDEDAINRATAVLNPARVTLFKDILQKGNEQTLKGN